MKYASISQRGVALIAVLWLVAAMGLIITGIVRSVRSEVHTAGVQRQATVAGAQADAAILLALQNLHALQKEPLKSTQVMQVQFEDRASEVTVQPLNGMIDLNNASIVLLTEMYRHAGGLDPALAQAMAQATIETRQSKNSKGATQGFDAIEDLMRVPAMTYDLYAKINSLVTANLKEGNGRVNPMAASVDVLQVLTGGDGARANSLATGRGSGSLPMDTSFLKPEFIEMAPSRSLQLEVGVKLPGGGNFQKTWQVFWSTDPRSGLPWRVLDMRQSIQQPAPSDY